MQKIAVCVSGGGTNLQAIMDRIADGSIKNTEIAVVISNKENAFALARARNAGLPAACISPKDYPDKEGFADAMTGIFREYNVGLVVFAGYLVVVPDKIIKEYRNRIINIHPSLIPAH